MRRNNRVQVPIGAPGELLGEGLRVVAHLRRGQDLDVYDCWDERRFCRVVVKALRPDRAADADAGRRLREEGRLLQDFAHPHLVRAYELREAPPLVVLETLGGATLGALLADDILAPAEAAVLGVQVGSALAYLHGHGLLHLDVKPSNVVATGGQAKLLDLSIARPPGPGKRELGTWCYAAPEQLRGEDVTAAADVWGLGLLLHEAVTGRAVFDDDDADHPQLIRRAPLASALRAGVPERLDDLLHAMLQPDPLLRPALADVLGVLTDVSGASPATAGVP